MGKRPNIVLITSDQQRWDCFGFGPRQVKMPHVERLARKGTRFDCCITANALCQPARASILTGMLPLTHGVADNGVDLDPALADKGFAAHLGRNGYKTAIIGKAHFSSKATFKPTGQPECQFSSVDFGPDWTGPYMGFEHAELMVVGHFSRVTPPKHISPMPFTPPNGLHYERWFHGRGTPGEARKLWEASSDGKGLLAAQTWNSALPAAWHPTTWVTDQSIAYLRQRAQSDEPFCLWVSYPDPHHPFDCPEPWSKMYDPASVDLPEHRTLDLERRPWWHQKLYGEQEKIGFDEYTKPGGKQTVARINRPTEEQLRYITANYYGMISFLDDGIGRVMSALQDLGLDDNTIIIFTTDHGELLGDHGLMLKGPTLYESLVRVGMVMVAPDAVPGHVVTEPISTLDLAATFYDYAGVSAPDGIQSRSIRNLLDPDAGGSREFAINEWIAGSERYGFTLDLRMIRTKRYKAIFELNSGAGELYDLQEDPNEMVNRFDDPAFKQILSELEQMMRSRPGPMLEKMPERSGLS